MIPSPGTQLGIYRLIQRLGAGGMGEVWKAEDTRLHRNVAIKLLPASMTGDEESRARLLREARTAGQLYHPNIATIHGIELEGEAPYIVMEYVDGESLTQAIASRRLDETRVAEIGRGIADALAEAHAKGIAHRDIKPDNVVLAGARVKVLDFGIAKRYGETAEAPPGEIVTEAGVVLGTVNYMSPEQATGKPLDGRSDIFSLGVMLYQALAGRLPFQGKSNLETLKQILRSEPPELAAVAPGVSREMAAIVARCLRKPLEERYQSADELARDLARVALRITAETPPRPVPIPVPPRWEPEAVATEIQPVPLPSGRAATTSPDERAISPGMRRYDQALVAQPIPVSAPEATPVPLVNAAPPPPPPQQPPPLVHDVTAPGHRSHVPWVIAGASFVVVFAIAGGVLVAKLAGSKGDGNAAAPAAGIAAPVSTTGSAETSAAPSGGRAPAAPPPNIAPATAGVASPRPREIARPTTPVEAASASIAPAPTAGTPYRVAMNALSTGGWRYLDDDGALTPGAEVAEGLFRQVLEKEPGSASATVNLAVIQLFRRRYDVAQKSLHPVLADGTLAREEVALASWAFSASSVAPTGNGVADFEKALDAALVHYKDDARFVAFARDVRWLVRRGARR